jgi:lysophospholipase L1-like esterase
MVTCFSALKAQVPDGPPPAAKPSESGWGFYKGWPEGWNGLHAKLLARTAQGGVDIVFLGDSLTALWDKEGKAVWDLEFTPLKAANYGVGSDSTRQVIWRIENGELDGLKPKLVVLMIGTNNIYQDFNSGTDPEIVEAVAKIIFLIKQKTPEAKILLLGVLPRQNKFFTDRTTALNKALADYAAANQVPFGDFSPKFLNEDGTINTSLYKSDLVHLTAEGYQILGDALKPLVEVQMKP